MNSSNRLSRGTASNMAFLWQCCNYVLCSHSHSCG